MKSSTQAPVCRRNDRLNLPPPKCSRRANFASKVGDQHSRVAFVHGLHDILLVGAAVAAIGAVLAGLLVRPQDFVASGPPRQADAQAG